jgi:hypothetical protein
MITKIPIVNGLPDFSQVRTLIQRSMLSQERTGTELANGTEGTDSLRAYNYYKSIRYQERDLVEKYSHYYDDKNRWDKLVKVKFNLTKAVTEKLSTLYNEPTVVTFKDPALAALWAEVRGFQSVSQMKDRYTFLTGMTAVRPIWISDAPDAVGVQPGKIVFAVYKRHQMIITPDPVVPTAIAEVVFFWKVGGVTMYHYWSPDRFIEAMADGDDPTGKNTKGATIIQDIENPYGRIPATFYRNQLDEESPYGGEAALALVDANLVLNKYETNLHWINELQAFSQLVLINADANFVPKVGPGNYLRVGEKGDAKFINPDPGVSNVLEDVNHKIDNLLSTEGIPESAVRVVKQESGFHLALEQRALENYRRRRAELFRDPDVDLARLTVQVMLHNTGKSPLKADPEVSVAYTRPIQALSQEEREYQDWRLRNNLTTGAALLQLEDPNLTPDQAAEKWKENQEANAANGIRVPSGDDLKIGDDV